MALNILRDDCYIGPYQKQIHEYLLSRDLNQRQLESMLQTIKVYVGARNKDMHTLDVDDEGGMVGVVEHIDIIRLKELRNKLQPVIDKLKTTLSSAAIKVSDLPFAGAGMPKEERAAKCLNPAAPEWSPG
jgi:hypothetical protein